MAWIEKDRELHFERVNEVQEQKLAPWGLARISHRETLNESTMSHYLYSESGGRGVDVYVPDTGINVGHVDFEGRAYWSTTIPAKFEDEDHHGHGTHCSGTIVGKRFGVAKKARVFAIKISEPDSHGRGKLSDGLKGIEWAVNAHFQNVSRAMKDPSVRKSFKGSVMSIGFASDRSSAFNAALNAAVDAGMHIAVAAGNDNYDACKRSPASAQKPISVGASNFTDDLAWFSNYGPCVDIFAPGVDILSSWIGGTNASRHTSGTSIASPHVAGLLAYLLSLQPNSDSQYAVDGPTPTELKSLLHSLGTRDVLSGLPPDTKNVRRRLSVILAGGKVLIVDAQILVWNGAGKSNLTAL